METIINTKPKAMFFYTKPNDVSAAVSFSMFNKKIDRYLIDLTDHAFWLGVKSNDYFWEAEKCLLLINILKDI
ncbi:MAG: hypothetical protein V8R51_08850 [Clostridia bacterium]